MSVRAATRIAAREEARLIGVDDRVEDRQQAAVYGEEKRRASTLSRDIGGS